MPISEGYNTPCHLVNPLTHSIPHIAVTRHCTGPKPRDSIALSTVNVSFSSARRNQFTRDGREDTDKDMENSHAKLALTGPGELGLAGIVGKYLYLDSKRLRAHSVLI